MTAKRLLDEELARAIALNLEAELAFGLDGLPRGPEIQEQPETSPMASNLADQATASGLVAGLTLPEIASKIEACRACVLCETREKTVPGQGAARARLMFVGEAPGAEEDLSGEPFVGRAGQLLTKMIEAMKLSREEVFIANVVKCRPPGNRNPLPEEISACLPYLRAQIDLVQPEIICSLGAVATKALTGSEERISRLRGQKLEWDGRIVIPTYHPSYLLREPAKKREAWADLQAVMAELGLN